MGGLCSNDGPKFSMRALVHHPDPDDGDTRSPALRRLLLAGQAGKGSDSEAPSPDGCTDSKGSSWCPERSILAKGKTGEQKGKTQRKGRNHRKSQKKKKKNASQMVRFTSHHSMSQVTPILFNYILQIWFFLNPCEKPKDLQMGKRIGLYSLPQKGERGVLNLSFTTGSTSHLILQSYEVRVMDPIGAVLKSPWAETRAPCTRTLCTSILTSLRVIYCPWLSY